MRRIICELLLALSGCLGVYASSSVPGRPYEQLDKATRARLVRMAKCARAAYPKEVIPDGLRPLNVEEWRRCMGKDLDPGYVYDPDTGYLAVGTGLRARLMVAEAGVPCPGTVVVAFSGSDFGANLPAAWKDFATAFEFQRGKDRGQFHEALFVVKHLLGGMKASMDVVGHSLGGALTAYVLSKMPEERDRVRGWTFNGLGVPSPEGGVPAYSGLMANVRCTKDPVSNCPGTVHDGQVYDIQYASAGQMRWHRQNWHGINEMIRQMSRPVFSE